jgi:hypothetical protein
MITVGVDAPGGLHSSDIVWAGIGFTLDAEF